MAKPITISRAKFKEAVDLDRVSQYFISTDNKHYNGYDMIWDGQVLEIRSLVSKDTYFVPASNIVCLRKALVAALE